jgi:AraC-like DNA-binding protein
MHNWGILYEVSYYLPILYGPLIFLFVRQSLLNKKFRTVDLLHFLPFALLITGLMLWMVFSVRIGSLGILFRTDTQMVLHLISLSVYHWFAFKYWKEYKSSLKTYFSETQHLQMNWIRHFIIASLIVCSVIAIAIYLIYVTNPHSRPYRYLFAVLTIFIYWISYTALTKPSIFSIIKGYAGENATIPVLPALVIHRPAKKYSNSGLSEEDKANILSMLHKTITEQKPYLNPELSINDLAILIKCNRHHLSQVMNESLQQSFYDFINQYRVDEARQLLSDPLKEGFKISSIAYDAGFNSLSTFNDVFKKVTGITPSAYKKQLHQLPKQGLG